jgi:hypothetical protein
MRRPLFAAIGALWLSAITAALATGNSGGQKNIGKAAIENMHVRSSLHAGLNNQDKYSLNKYGCRDEINKDLLIPMWCKQNKIGWGDPLYPFRSDGTESERNVLPHLWAGRRLSIDEF